MTSDPLISLPVYALKDALCEALLPSRPRVLLRAPTGSGKSTGVPPILAETGHIDRGRIIIIQPRRIAARLLAERVADLRHASLGDEVGYTVRFDTRCSARTRILYVTDGIFERMLLDNPSLEGIGTVIFDEFHERRLTSDLCLAHCLDLQEATRPDLALIVMSATLEVEGLESYLSPCTLLEAEGRMYPVEITHISPAAIASSRGTRPSPIAPSRGSSLTSGLPGELPVWENVARTVRSAATHADCGNILAFLPGGYEIQKTLDLLEHDASLRAFDIVPLHGQLSPDKQHAAVSLGSRPKIIISTNVAETSLSIDGLRTVVDSGLVRMARRDPRRDMDTLVIKKIARASAEQRAGRAGRTAPGRCFRLWSEPDHNRRETFEQPEVLRVELSPALLALSYWGIRDFSAFRWLTPPLPESLDTATRLLVELGALDEDHSLTPVGRLMAQFPLAPRLARLIIAGRDNQCLPEACLIAALIEGERLFTQPSSQAVHESFRDDNDYTDFQADLRALLFAEDARFRVDACRSRQVHARAARDIYQSYERLLRLAHTLDPDAPPFPARSFLPIPDLVGQRDAVIRCLLVTYPDHVGVRNGIATHTCKLVGGKRGRIPSGSAAYRDLGFIATDIAEVEGKSLETYVSRCTSLNPDDLAAACPDAWIESYVASYDPTKRRVIRLHRQSFRDLVFLEKERGEPTTDEAAPLLAERIADGTLKLTHWNHEVEQWIRRLNMLRDAMPELELPSFDDADRVVAFSLLCEGALGYKDIKDRPVLPVLKEWLSPLQRHALDSYAPTQITLPNGQKPKLTYDELGIPRIALTVQRLYDTPESPRIADGRVTVTTEVLAPNQRPWQITQNLASFWLNGYPQMKKELAARYPKHQWR